MPVDCSVPEYNYSKYMPEYKQSKNVPDVNIPEFSYDVASCLLETDVDVQTAQKSDVSQDDVPGGVQGACTEGARVCMRDGDWCSVHACKMQRGVGSKSAWHIGKGGKLSLRRV